MSRSETGDWFAIDRRAIPGDSGGPVFNERGEVMGLMVGGGPDREPWRVRVDQSRHDIFLYSEQRDGRRLGPATTLVTSLSQALREVQSPARTVRAAAIGPRR